MVMPNSICQYHYIASAIVKILWAIFKLYDKHPVILQINFFNLESFRLPFDYDK